MIESDYQSLAAGNIVDFFELDASAIGGATLYWHNGVNELGADVVWQGNTYTKMGIEAQGFESSGNDKLPRPTLTVSNVTGLVGALVRDLNDLIGASVTRRRTMVKYLDAVNFAAGNAQADPNVFFPDEVWGIDRKVAENGIFIQFELAAAFDLAGVKLPRRQVIQNICTVKYRGAECGYAGVAVADKLDNPTAILADDACSHRVTGCGLRFGANSPLPFGGFVGVAKQ
ncbi:MAG: phage minor tail protein L [Methylophaga sp.]|nr:MAG: phage minor tail protein L [Methylophaga sp.]